MEQQTENQHYVPRFYLRKFQIMGSNSSESIWVLDKQAERIYRSSIEKAGSENYFFKELSVEEKNTNFENTLVPHYEAIIDRFNKADIEPLSSFEIAPLSILVSYQWLRTRMFRKQLEHNVSAFTETIVNNLRECEGLDDESIGKLISMNNDSDSIEALQSDLLFNKTSIILLANRLITDFHWEIGLVTNNEKLVTSDHPISMMVGHLGHEGNEISFPLSEKLLLILRHTTSRTKSRSGFLEPKHVFESNHNQYSRSSRFMYSSDKSLLEAILGSS